MAEEASGTEQMASWFIQHIGTVKVLDVNVLVLREARDELAIGRSPYTVNRYLIVMHSAWNWARHSGLIPKERRWPERLSALDSRRSVHARRRAAQRVHATGALEHGAQAAGLKNFCWHDLRHTCASILAQNHATLHEIAEVLGHKALVTTSRYAHLTEGAALPAHTALDAKLTRKHEPPRG
jgi:integrase